MSRRYYSLCNFSPTSCHFLSLRAKLYSPSTPFSIPHLYVPLMSETINPSSQWVSPLRLVNHRHRTTDRTEVQSYCDEKNYASIRHECRHIRVPVNVTWHCVPIQTVPCFIKISPNTTKGVYRFAAKRACRNIYRQWGINTEKWKKPKATNCTQGTKTKRGKKYGRHKEGSNKENVVGRIEFMLPKIWATRTTKSLPF